MKKLAALCLCCALTFSMTACSGSTPAANDKPADSTGTTTSAETADTTKDTSTDTNTQTSSGAESGSVDSKTMYQSFLAGTEKLYTDYKPFYTWTVESEEPVPYYDNKNGYTLTEFVAAAREAESNSFYDAYNVSEVKYSFIDCGNDGEPELALEVTYASSIDDITYDYVIKNKDGKLQLMHQVYSAYRTYGSLSNAYGLIVSGGSASAMEHTFDEAYIDANGDYQFAYTENECYSLWDLDTRFTDYLSEEDEEASEFTYHTSYSFREFDMEDYEAYYKDLIYCAEIPESYEFDDLDAEKNLLFYQDLFESAGVKLYSLEEINKLIADKEAEIGLTQAIKDGPAIEWEDIEIDFTVANGLTEVTVSNVDELIDALGNRKIINLKPGTYNLTDWTVEAIQKGTIEPSFIYNEELNDIYENGLDIDSAILYYGGTEEEPELYIKNINNCTLRSADSASPATIVCTPRSATVLNLSHCDSITFDGIVLGHTDGNDECSGDVVGISSCSSIKLKACDLYGCGATAININNSNAITVDGGRIHDCTVGCVSSNNTYVLNFNNVTFEDVVGYEMLSFVNVGVTFQSCTFRNLQGNFLYSGDSYVSFNSCTFDPELEEQVRALPGFNEAIEITDFLPDNAEY